ncbi:MAG: PH domain-containing protein [Tomitella sp.]|nr:PH domain-containing protein [Tomitella sp.]
MTPDSNDTTVETGAPATVNTESSAAATTAPRSGAKVLFTARTHAKMLFKPVFVAVACVALMVVAGIYIPGDLADGWAWKATEIVLALLIVAYAIYPVVQWRFSRYTLTTTQMASSRGIVWRTRKVVPISRIAQIQTERGLLDRIFGCGTLVIFDQSASDPLRFPDIPDVLDVADQLNELI